MAGRLVERKDSGTGAAYALQSGHTTIGRDETSDIVLTDHRVSRRHAEIRREGADYMLYDLESRNGTRVNGERLVSPHRLRHGDIITFPGVTLMFGLADETATMLPEVEPDGLLQVSAERAEARVNGRPVSLTPKEFSALTLLYERSGTLVTKEELAARVWPEYVGAVSDDSIEQVIYRLRHKLGTEGDAARLLVTVRGLGYRLQRE